MSGRGVVWTVGVALGLMALLILPTGVEAEDRIEWEAIGYGGGGNIFSVAVSPHDPDVLLGASDVGGYYWTGDGGQTWSLANNVHIETDRPAGYGTDIHNGFAFHPTDPDVAYSGGWRSEDKGRTWVTHVDDSRIYGAGTAIDPNNPDIVYAWGYAEIYRSSDGWRSTSCTGASGGGTVCAPSGPNSICQLGTKCYQKSCLPPAGSGQESTAGCNGSDGNRIRGMAVDPQNSARLVACTTLGLFQSMDSGEKWIQIEPAGLAPAVCEGGTVPDGTACQLNSECGTGGTCRYAGCSALSVFSDPATGDRSLFAAITTRPFIKGPVRGKPAPNDVWVDIDQWQGGIYRSDDWGASWVEISGFATDEDPGNPVLSPNASFETGEGGDPLSPQASGWTQSSGVVRDCAVGQGGTSCSIRFDAGTTVDRRLTTEALIPIVAGQDYRLRAWYRVSNSTTGYPMFAEIHYYRDADRLQPLRWPWGQDNVADLWVFRTDSAGPALDFTDWRRLEARFRPPDGANYADVNLRAFRSDGTKWVDELSLKAAHSLPKLASRGENPYFVSYLEVAVDPLDPMVLYAGTERNTFLDLRGLFDAGGVWKTEDGGAHWSHVARRNWRDNMIDAGTSGPVCGDNVCGGLWETCVTCPIDCTGHGKPTGACCGDGICAGKLPDGTVIEDAYNCLADCPFCDTGAPDLPLGACCGDGFCAGERPAGTVVEDTANCPADCPPGQPANPRPSYETNTFFDFYGLYDPRNTSYYAVSYHPSVWSLHVGRDKPGVPGGGTQTVYWGGADHWKSTDGGKTWTEMSSSLYTGADSPPGTWAENGDTSGVYVYPVLTDKRNGKDWLLYGDEDNYLMVSYNGGKSFSLEGWQWSGYAGQVGPSTPTPSVKASSATALVPDPIVDTRIYAAVSHTGVHGFDPDEATDGGVVVGDYDATPADGGVGRWTWSRLGDQTTFPPTQAQIGLIMTDAGGFVASVYGRGVWTLPPGATDTTPWTEVPDASWDPRPAPGTEGWIRPYRLAKDPTNSRLYLGVGYPRDPGPGSLPGETGVWESEDDGATWRRITPSCSAAPTCSVCNDPPNCTACSDSCMDMEPVTNIAVVDANTILASTWFSYRNRTADASGNYTGDGGVYRGTRDVDGNWTWTKELWQPLMTGVATSPASSTIVHALAAQRCCGNIVTGQRAGIYRSTDSGLTWTLLANNGLMNLRMDGRLYADPYDVRRLFATSIGSGLFKGTITCGTPLEGFPDVDTDGIADCADPCPNDPLNDADGDGVCGDVDNCPSDPNTDQADFDADGEGDVCDTCTENGACEAPEDCSTCSPDCVSGSIGGGSQPGNGVCEPGENCIFNPDDCRGVTTGNPSGRYCCSGTPGGFGGENPVDCTYAACSSDGFQCDSNPPPASTFCCGQNGCETGEDGFNCELDCGPPPFCGDGNIDPGEDCDGVNVGGATCASFGCTGGSLTCTGTCGIDISSCTGCPPPCDNDGVCESGENCSTCPGDCVSGGGTAACNNGVCEPWAGEDCLSCPDDCNGKQNGAATRRFCCGDGEGDGPVGCTDSRCVESGFACSDTPSPVYCCGDATCTEGETSQNCELDCGPPSTGCNDNAVCEPGEDCMTCGDCEGKLNGASSRQFCCGNGVTEGPEGDGSRCDGNF